MNIDTGVIVAIAGLLSLFAAHQFVSKGLIGGPIARTGYYLSIPVAVSLLWRIANGVGWWTIAVFVLGSLFVGYVNGKILVNGRESGKGTQIILGLQPIQTIIFLAAAIICWFL